MLLAPFYYGYYVTDKYIFDIRKFLFLTIKNIVSFLFLSNLRQINKEIFNQN